MAKVQATKEESVTEYSPRDLETRAQLAPWYNGIELFIRARDLYDHGKLLVIESIIWKEYNPQIEHDATLKVAPEKAQILMDDLWSCGFRPTEGTGSAGALAATQLHLKDMKRVAFYLLEKK